MPAPLPFRSTVAAYDQQAADLFAGWGAADADATRTVRHHHPLFVDERVPWLPRDLSEAELRAMPFALADARLALARWYTFRDWPSLVEWVEAVLRPDAPVGRFESAVEAVVAGDIGSLQALLRRDPDLIRARSSIVTPHQPPRHQATLLHYVAANGVENRRQITPANAVRIAHILLEAGAEPDALAWMYEARHTTMTMLVSSAHPARAGLQGALAETLLDFGASVDGPAAQSVQSPLLSALAFGYLETAQVLVRRGARLDNLAAVAGLGRLGDARRLLGSADAETRHRATALAAQHGQTEVLALLLDAGEDPNRFNPSGNHGHSTPLHQAVSSNHRATVELLVERGARLDIRDTIWHGTPLGWAEFGNRTELAEFLRARMAPPQ